MKTERTLHGTLLLDLTTVETAQAVFALQALMLRAAGMEVVVVGRGKDVSMRAAAMGIAFNDALTYPDLPSSPSYAIWKHSLAMEATKRGVVLWPDVDLCSTWKGPAVDNVPGLVILNWSAVVRGGGFVMAAGAHAVAQG